MTDISFVCQSGDLEPKAVLLAASLRRWFPGDIRLVACHPDAFGPLRQGTLRALSDLDAQVVPVSNPLKPDYPIGHKLAALALAGGSETAIFLDSDMVALRAPDRFPTRLGAVAATRNHFGKSEWEFFYGLFGLEVPSDGPATLGWHETTSPYFNAGMIAAPSAIVDDLSKMWIDTALALDRDSSVDKARFLDQIALPIAAARMGLQIGALEPKWNFPAWLWRAAEHNPILLHYQRLDCLQVEAPSSVQVASGDRKSVRDALHEFGWLS